MDINFTNLAWIAWVLVVIGWFVSVQISKTNRKASEINKISDEIKSSIRELEDIALDFWIKDEDKVYQFEFNIHIKRIYSDLRLLEGIDKNFSIPNEVFSMLRKSITLNIESEERPVTEFSNRARSISLSCYKLINNLPRK